MRPSEGHNKPQVPPVGTIAPVCFSPFTGRLPVLSRCMFHAMVSSGHLLHVYLLTRPSPSSERAQGRPSTITANDLPQCRATALSPRADQPRRAAAGRHNARAHYPHTSQVARFRKSSDGSRTQIDEQVSHFVHSFLRNEVDAAWGTRAWLQERLADDATLALPDGRVETLGSDFMERFEGARHVSSEVAELTNIQLSDDGDEAHANVAVRERFHVRGRDHDQLTRMTLFVTQQGGWKVSRVAIISTQPWDEAK